MIRRYPFTGRPAAAVVAVVLVVSAHVPDVAAGAAQPPAPRADVQYADAVAKEQAVRAAFAGDQSPEAILKAMRTVVADFEGVVRQYPTSGLSDDALWKAAQLSLDAFGKFGESQDRNAAARLLRSLTSQYPASPFAKQAASIIATTAPARTAQKPAGAPAADKPVPRAAAERPAATTGTAPVAAAPPLATIKGIRRTIVGETARVTISLDREVPFKTERLDNPPRMFVDLNQTRAAPALIDRTLRFDDAANLVRQIRVGRHPNNITRIVVDATGSSDCDIYPLYGPYRLVIDCMRGANAPPLPLPARRLVSDWKRLAMPAGRAARLPAAAEMPPAAAPPTSPAAATGTPARLPSRNVAGGFSIARQLGLRVSRIVIDPGHGGDDPGALGRGMSEAEVVLDIALRLEEALLKVPGVEVILTRRDDTFVPLEERTAIANREGADLFLSIHTNASTSTRVNGVETYFLNFATTLGAEAVAARENAASGHAMSALPDFVKAIALHNKLDESRDFATFVQRAMIERLRGANKAVKDLGVKQAPFVVLIGAAMPSVLAEVSFLTHAQEARLLKTPAYRQRIADALLAAIQKYQGSLTRTGTGRTGRTGG